MPGTAIESEPEDAVVLIGTCSAGFIGLGHQDSCSILEANCLDRLLRILARDLFSDCQPYYCCFGLHDLHGQKDQSSSQELFLDKLKNFDRTIIVSGSKNALARYQQLLSRKNKDEQLNNRWSRALLADGPVLGYLSGLGSGAALCSLNEEITVCNVDIAASATRFSVFSRGRLIDQCSIELGSTFLRFGNDGSLLDISDCGETFLDAVAKLKLFQLNQVPSPDLLALVAALYSELLVHCALSANPPQVVCRVLSSAPLRLDYKVDRYFLSGGVSALISDRSLESVGGGRLECAGRQHEACAHPDEARAHPGEARAYPGEARAWKDAEPGLDVQTQIRQVKDQDRKIQTTGMVFDMGQILAEQIPAALNQRQVKVQISNAAASATIRGALLLSTLLEVPDGDFNQESRSFFAQLRLSIDSDLNLLHLLK